nr:hypothetical protein [uncultured Draconibacterium sp.]
MGIFSNSSIKKFRNLFIETSNLIAGFSFGTLQISNSVAKQKIEANYEELKEMFHWFDNPFDEYFNVYLTSVIGEKLSVGQAVYIIWDCMNQALYFNEKISQRVTEEVVERARQISATYGGRAKINKLICEQNGII